MRISTNKKTRKVDRQKQTIIEYSVNNNFKIDEFMSDVITGGTKADNEYIHPCPVRGRKEMRELKLSYKNAM